MPPKLSDPVQSRPEPSRPTRLEDVPDRRVIVAKHVANHSYDWLWFYDGSNYWRRSVSNNGEWDCGMDEQGTVPLTYIPCNDFKLTDCVVELADVEVGVVE